jgi:hypothetical protein
MQVNKNSLISEACVLMAFSFGEGRDEAGVLNKFFQLFNNIIYFFLRIMFAE